MKWREKRSSGILAWNWGTNLWLSLALMGGGKSTLAKVIVGILKPTSGTILWNGTDITETSITERAKMGISYAFQQPVQFKGLRVRDLMTLASGKKAKFTDACDVLSEVGLCARDYMDMGIPSWTLPTYTSCP